MSTKVRKARLRRAARGTFALLAATACGVITGVDDYAVGGQPRRIVFGAAACEACITTQCSAEFDACSTEEACKQQAACIFGCNDGECLHGCFSSYRFSQTAKELLACQVERCHAPACGSCGTPFSAQAVNCSRCVEEDPAPGLCDRSRDCLANDECRAYLACYTRECEELGVGDPKCRMSCGSRYPEAARNYYQSVGTRYFFGCREDCNAGKHWECEQPAVWPPTTGGTAEIEIRLPSPVAGVVVRACTLGDSLCAVAVDQDTSDVDGTAVLEVPQTGTASVYFEIHGARPYLFVPFQGITGDLVLWSSDGWIPTDQALKDMMNVRGESLAEGTGGVVVLVADCVGGHADFGSTSPEVTIESTPNRKPYYMGDAQLDAGGNAALVNLPPGVASLRLSRRGAGKDIALATVPVRAGMFTFVTFNYPQWL